MDEIARMLGMSSSGPKLPWLWIIEYLSSFRQIDSSIIRGLIEAAPVLPRDLGKDTSERVALRCLEELFSPKNGLENVTPPDSRVVFDLSASCEDVLKHIVQEVPVSDLKKAGPELLRWDVQPFVMHKRASLPKCALEQLKDSILEETPVLDSGEIEPTWRFDDSDDENGNQEGNLIPQTQEIDNEDGLLERNLIPIKRSINDLLAENLVGLVSGNQDRVHNDLLVNAKKFKQDATCTGQSVEQIPIPFHGDEQLEDESGRTIKVTEVEGNNLEPCPEQMREYEDERSNIALDKSLFLSSRCMPSHNPLGKSSSIEQNFCVKCNKNGEVLVCSSSGCPLVVHESCLVSPARYDDQGNFYCPSCAYSDSLSKYLEAMNETSLARKELAAFMELCSKKLTELQGHPRLNGDEDLVAVQVNGHLGEREHRVLSQNRVVKYGPSASSLDGNKLCIEEVFTCEAVRVQGEKNEEQEKVVHVQRSVREHEYQQNQLPDNRKCSDDKPTGEHTETIPADQVEVEGKIVKEAVQPQTTNPPQQPVCAPNSDGDESSTAVNDKFIISCYPIRKRKSETKYTFPPIPKTLRRKKLRWTKNEEEMLRRGVEKYASHDGTIPWTKILDMGSSVFLCGRTAIDLKDKWRNLQKGWT